jgi:hypothetical protein
MTHLARASTSDNVQQLIWSTINRYPFTALFSNKNNMTVLTSETNRNLCTVATVFKHCWILAHSSDSKSIQTLSTSTLSHICS